MQKLFIKIDKLALIPVLILWRMESLLDLILFILLVRKLFFEHYFDHENSIWPIELSVFLLNEKVPRRTFKINFNH